MQPNLAEDTGLSWTVVRVLCAVSICTAAVAVIQHGSTPRAVLLGVIAALPWLLAASRMMLPWWVAGGLEIACTLGFILEPSQFDVAPFLLVIIVAVFAAGESAPISLTMLAASSVALVGSELSGHFDGVAVWILGLSLGWLGGFSIRLQEQAHEAREERAATEERRRIARELHDVVAHSLAVTMLHLTGARLALRRDPDEAETALLQAERSGRQSMADIRRVVGLLGDTGTSAPVPGAPDIEDLVREFSTAGLPVTLSVTGDLHAVPPAVGLTLYRIVQESITNVVKHAPGGEVDVRIVVAPDSARLSVRNPCGDRPVTSTNGGFGIAGMSERAALIGGTVQAGRTHGEWCVTAELPIGAA